MATIANDLKYQMLVASIHETFKGSDKVADILSSLHDLFKQFDENVGETTTENKYERKMLLGVVTILLDHLIKDQNNNIQTDTVYKFLQSMKNGIDQSIFISNLMQEIENSTSILKRVKKMFDAEGVTETEIDNVTRKIDEHLLSSYTANNVLTSNAWSFDFDEHDRENIARLSNGWEKNFHEMNKRSQKLESFREDSNESLRELEESIEKSKARNQNFRETLNETSTRISSLVEQLHDNTQKSEYLRKEIEIVDSTITDIEAYKEKTCNEYAELEQKLLEKENSLIDLLKKIDDSLEDTLSKHQRMIERHDTFNEALEELAECYSNFEFEEQKILKRHKIEPVEFQIDSTLKNSSPVDSEKISNLTDERDEAIRRFDVLKKQNEALSYDVEDLFNLNTKLCDENAEFKERLNQTPNTSEDDQKLKQLLELRAENEDLRKKNENLRSATAKTQEIFIENKELVEETAQLQEDIGKLEAKIKEYETNTNTLEQTCAKLLSENESFANTLQEIGNVKQTRVLHIKTNMADIITVTSDTKTNAQPSLEALLQNERDRNLTLEKANKTYQATATILANLCHKIGLDQLQSETTYNISIQSESGTHVFNSSGVTLTKKETETFKPKKFEEKVTKTEEYIIDEMGVMLQESYQHSDELKNQNKVLQSQIHNLRLELEHKEERMNSTSPQKVTATYQQHALGSFIQLFTDMGISHLQYGSTYSIHYQVISSKGPSRRTSSTFQHSVNAINFDNIKNVLASIGENKPLITSPSPKPSRKVSRAPTLVNGPSDPVEIKLNTLHSDVDSEEIKPVVQIASSSNPTTREVERLLRIAKRDNEELIKANRDLRRELSIIKDNKGRFMDEQMQKNRDRDDDDDDDQQENSSREHITSDDLKDLQHAYDLSDANCTFLEKQNKTLTNRLQQVESIVEHYKNEIVDNNEDLECFKRETKETSKKYEECKRQVNQFKQELEYLEADVEYLKVKLAEAGVDHPIKDGLHIYPKKRTETTESALHADFQALLAEKNSLILECESLSAKIKFLEAENKFALAEARLIERCEESQSQEEIVNKTLISVQEMEITREKSNSFIEREVKSEGLAKRFGVLQKENRQLRKEFEETVSEKVECYQRIGLLEVEIKALQSSNKDLEDRVVEAERSLATKEENSGDVIVDLSKRLSIIHEQTSNNCNVNEILQKECQLIKEEAIFITQENEEIKESNELLLRRNTDLRRESLAAGAARKHLEALKEKLNNLENENTILKIESMKQKGKRGSLVRKSSQNSLWSEVRKLHLNTTDSSTQTEPLIQVAPSSAIESDDDSVDVEELEFVIEDLTRRNSEFKTKLFNQEKKMGELEKENNHLEEVNMKILQRNTLLKEQLENERKMNEKSNLSESEMSDDQGLGINFFFKNDILSEYEKAELEEEIKSLKYENRLLKEDLLQKSEEIKVLQMKILETKQQQLYADYHRDSPKSFHPSIGNKEKSQDNILQMEIKNLSMKIGSLEKDKEVLAKKNQENLATIEQLERQVLYGDLQKTHETMNDEIFNEKFLLKSEYPLDKVTQDDIKVLDELSSEKTDKKDHIEKGESSKSVSDDDSDGREDDVCVKNVNGNENELDDVFTECIKEGELASEMEEFFRRYTESSSTFSKSFEDFDNEKCADGIKEDHITDVSTAQPIKATVIGKPGRFRAKEALEKTLENQEMEIKDQKEKLLTAVESSKEHESKTKSLQQELVESNKKLLVSQQSFMEISLSLNDRLDEVNHLQHRNLEMEREEERSANEILQLESEIKNRDQEIKELVSLVEECKYKIESCKRESEEYKCILEEQEKLLQNTHENSTVLQRNVNELYKEVSEKSESIKELKEQNLSLSFDKEAVVGEKISHETKLRKLEDKKQALEKQLVSVEKDNQELKVQIQTSDLKYVEIKEGMLVNEENNRLLERERKQLQESFVEQKTLIDSLRQQLKESKEVVALYEETNIDAEIFDEDREDGDVNGAASNNLSFEIHQASMSSKTATEMSFENANITLPEIQIRKYSKEHSMQRSQSVPTSQISNSNRLFPTKYFQPKNEGLSEVSDIEENQEQDDTYSVDYVRKLKVKLKKCTDKIRDRNKIIQTQNEDIDNFLEDIALKEYTIFQLRDEIEQLRKQHDEIQNQSNELRVESESIERLCDVKTPSFLSESAADNLTKELIHLAEECCQEIDYLQNFVENTPSTLEIDGLREKLHTSQDRVKRLRSKLSKCIELGLISPSVSQEERNSSPNILELPGKTVNEIKTENDLLNLYNEELKQEIEELQQQLLANEESPLHSSMFQENEDEEVMAIKENRMRKDNKITELSEEVKSLNKRLRTAEFQIEKDWEIIENQSQQLENLHQQFIEQRDENVQHKGLLKESEDQLMKMADELNMLKQSEDEMHHLEALYMKFIEQQEGKQVPEKDVALDRGILETVTELKEEELQGAYNDLHNRKHPKDDQNIDSLDQTINHLQDTNVQELVAERMANEIQVMKQQHQFEINQLHQEYKEKIQKYREIDSEEKESQLNNTLEEVKKQHEIKINNLKEEHQMLIREKEQRNQKMNAEMLEYRQRSKAKEEELERLLLEKEDGIEKLHSMIRELEKSLSNSQVHIEGILRESMENRETEESKDRLLEEQVTVIAHLKEELGSLQKPCSQTDRSSDAVWIGVQARLSDLYKYVKTAKSTHSEFRQQVIQLQQDYQQYLNTIMRQLHSYLQNIAAKSTESSLNRPEITFEERNGFTNLMSPASSDSEALFVPRASSSDSQSPIDSIDGARSSDGVRSSKYLKYEKEKQQLIEKHKEALKRKDSVHRMQIDTVIRSLAKRHMKKSRPFLTPSPELFIASTRMEQSEFLRTCVSKVKYSSDGC